MNDILVHNAEPLLFTDYFATGRIDPKSACDVIQGIANGCELAGCTFMGMNFTHLLHVQYFSYL